jgi:uncharacterized protein
MSVYVDTSAAAKLLVEEPESPALADHLDAFVANDVPLVSSLLLETELRRVAVREGLEQARVSDLISRFDLYEPSRSLFHEAGILPGAGLRTLDALHLATALRVAVTTVVTYDVRQAVAARELGLLAEHPGADLARKG